MSFLFPRTISVRRQSVPAGSGAVKFGGDQPANETVVAASLPANIQYDRTGIAPHADLPSDSRRSQWRIVIPAANAALGLIAKNDIVVDDLGNRYQVCANYWNSLGYALRVELMAV